MASLIVKMIFMTGLLTLSQVCLKKCFSKKPLDFKSFTKLFEAVCEPYFIGSVLSMALAFIIWTKVIRTYDFTTAYPLVSISYFWALLAGYYIFHEPISALKILGTATIALGVVLITLK